MRPGARSPEELESLLEDAFVTRDRDALAGLFEDGAVLVGSRLTTEAHGEAEITRVAVAMWERELTYLADPWRIVQARDTALVLTRSGVNVVRRGADRGWRYAISLLDSEPATKGAAR